MFAEVYKIVRLIPVGKVATYGQIAMILGTRDSRRVFADGSLAPGYAFGGLSEQMKKLKKERVKFVGEKVDLEKCRWSRQVKLLK